MQYHIPPPPDTHRRRHPTSSRNFFIFFFTSLTLPIKSLSLLLYFDFGHFCYYILFVFEISMVCASLVKVVRFFLVVWSHAQSPAKCRHVVLTFVRLVRCLRVEVCYFFGEYDSILFLYNI